MNKLIKANFYRISRRMFNVIVMILAPLIIVIVSIIKAMYRDGYLDYEDIARCAFEWHMVPASIAIVIITYALMSDYFDSRIYEAERWMGHKYRDIIISKLISTSVLISAVFMLWMSVLFLGYYLFFGSGLYPNYFLRLTSLFLIYLRVSVGAVLLVYLIRNFFVYVGLELIIWLLIVKKCKIHVGSFHVFNVTYKYQMSIISSFGGLNEMLIRKVIPYELLSFMLHFIVLYAIVIASLKKEII